MTGTQVDTSVYNNLQPQNPLATLGNGMNLINTMQRNQLLQTENQRQQQLLTQDKLDTRIKSASFMGANLSQLLADPDTLNDDKKFSQGVADVLSDTQNVSGGSIPIQQLAAMHNKLINVPANQRAKVLTNIIGGAYGQAGKDQQMQEALYGKLGSFNNGATTTFGTTPQMGPNAGAFIPAGSGQPMGAAKMALSPAEQAGQVTGTSPEIGPDGKPTGRFLPTAQPLGARLQQQGAGGLNAGGFVPIAAGANGAPSAIMPESNKSITPQAIQPLQQGSSAPTPAGTATAAAAVSPQINESQLQPTLPPNSVATGPSLGSEQAANEVGTVAGKQYAADTASAGQFMSRQFPMQQALSNIEKLGVDNLGPGTETRNQVASYIKSFFGPNIASVVPGVDPDKIQAYDETNKYLTQAAVNSPLNTPRTNDGLSAMFSGNPSTHISGAAAVDVLKSAIALDRANTAIADTYSGNPLDYPAYAKKMAGSLDPRAFGADMLTPKVKAAFIKSLGPTDGQAYKKFVDSYNLAIRSGLMNHNISSNQNSQPIAQPAAAGQ